MNSFEHFACSSSVWRYFSEHHLLPWVFEGQKVGEHALEIGAGYGAGARFLRTRAKRVTALEYDMRSAAKMRLKLRDAGVEIVCGDGGQLPFEAERFSCASLILVLHHLKSVQLQDRMLGEVMRVLRPGGALVGFEIVDSRMNRIGHIGSTFTPLTAKAAFERLTAAGFARVSVNVRGGAFRFSGAKAPGK